MIYSPATSHHNFSYHVYTAPFQWKLLIFIWKNLWCIVLEANKKQVPLKIHSLKIRTDSVNQILKNKEKVTKSYNINILTRITNRKILCVYLCLIFMISQFKHGQTWKNWPSPLGLSLYSTFNDPLKLKCCMNTC